MGGKEDGGGGGGGQETAAVQIKGREMGEMRERERERERERQVFGTTARREAVERTRIMNFVVSNRIQYMWIWDTS